MNVIKYLILIVGLISAQAKAENNDLLMPGVALGQPCWGMKGSDSKSNQYGLVCRDGVFRLASDKARWEEYKNIPAQRARELTMAATKEGATCHYLDKELILVCYWR